ncbi:MAG: thermonuclease family protein [Roseococcus sp.]
MPKSAVSPCLLVVASVLALLLGAPALRAEDRITGRVSVIDGDTIEIHGQRIRLEGIDAPESRQTCTDGSGKTWRCGKASAFALADKIGKATVSCHPHGRDRYKRVLAVCYLSDLDLNGWLVRNGWSVAYRKYSMDYVGDEELARLGHSNIWAGPFNMPWDWRKAH